MDSSFYIGYTNNLSLRLNEHNERRTRYTSKKAPWKLVYTESYTTKTAALKREIFLKRQKNKKFYDNLIASNKSNIGGD